MFEFEKKETFQFFFFANYSMRMHTCALSLCGAQPLQNVPQLQQRRDDGRRRWQERQGHKYSLSSLWLIKKKKKNGWKRNLC